MPCAPGRRHRRRWRWTRTYLISICDLDLPSAGFAAAAAAASGGGCCSDADLGADVSVCVDDVDAVVAAAPAGDGGGDDGFIRDVWRPRRVRCFDGAAFCSSTVNRAGFSGSSAIFFTRFTRWSIGSTTICVMSLVKLVDTSASVQITNKVSISDARYCVCDTRRGRSRLGGGRPSPGRPTEPVPTT